MVRYCNIQTSVVLFSNCWSLLIASNSFEDSGVAVSHTHVMDWWDSKRFNLSVAGKYNQPSAINIACKPASTSIFDRFKTLRASWTIAEIVSDTNPFSRPPVKVFFARTLATVLSMTGTLRTRPSLSCLQAYRGSIWWIQLRPATHCVRTVYKFLWQPADGLTIILSMYSSPSSYVPRSSCTTR